jgi:thiamine biosynthesis protein ThiI
MNQTYEILILHYAEIYLKGDYVKRQLEKVLEARVRYKLDKIGIQKPKIKWKHNSLWIQGSFSKENILYLAETFGISYVTPVLLCESTIPSIREAIEKLQENLHDTKPSSFCVRAKKDKRILMSHYSVEYEVSSFFQDWKVDLKNPELTIYLDLKTSECCIYFEKIKGPGGFPYGTQGKVVSLLSKGIDSPIAAYMMAKRGCEIIFLHMGTEKLTKIIDRFEVFAGKPITFISLDYIPFLAELKNNQVGKYQCVLCKIGMYLLANRVAKNKKARAIVTGENLGQVASQTLANIAAMDSFSNIPVIRPLIGFDKKEIIQMSRDTGLLDLYINPDCDFVPDGPSTMSSKVTLEKLMENIDYNNLLENFLVTVSSK